MLRALLLLLIPQSTWQKISASQWNVWVIFLISFIPLLLLTTAIEGLGMSRLGTSVSDFDRTIPISKEQAIYFQIVQLSLTLMVLLLGTKLVLWVCDGFHSPTTFHQAFTLTAYGITPLLWLRIIDGHPQMPTWICFALGSAGVFFILYHGIAFVLKPDTSVGFGLYLICSFVLVLLAGLAHFVAQVLAQRRFSFQTFTDPFFAIVERLF